jgi:large conductance mechanosensitive channel
MGILQEFREFAIKGNAIDMAVGIVIGAAFTKIVNSIVTDLLMPPLGLLIGGVEFKDLQIVLQAADEAATPPVALVAIRYGSFLDTVIQFLIVAVAVFTLVKVMNRVLTTRGSFIPGLGKKAEEK